MESINRSVIMLKSDSGAPQNQKNIAVLKLQADLNKLMIDLAVPFCPSPTCSLFLFDKEGNDHLAGEIIDGGLHKSISAMPLAAVLGAAVIDTNTLTFLLKSSGPDWAQFAARFKFKYLKQETGRHDEPEAPPPPKLKDPPPEMAPAAEPRVCDACPHVIRQDRINPFPSVYPGSEWVKISYPGPSGWWHYIAGKIRSGDTVIAKVLGVPGEYGMAPPIWLEGFGTYMRSTAPDACGYWLMFQDAETGEVLDMGLSPHGG